MVNIFLVELQSIMQL